MIVGVSKGPDRKPGMEKLILVDQEQPVEITPGASGLLLIQHIRDEAHRFAITGHRQRRGKATKQSVLKLFQTRFQATTDFIKTVWGLQGITCAGVMRLQCRRHKRQLAHTNLRTISSSDDDSI